MTSTFSIWIIPPEEDKKRFSKIINRLSIENTSPVFMPHITLIPKLEGDLKQVSDMVQSLASLTECFTLNLGSIDSSDNYWRAVFIKAIKDDDLISLYTQFLNRFKSMIIAKDKEFNPHLTLIYAKLHEGERKEILSSIDADTLPKSFLVRSLYIAAMDSTDPTKWIILKECILKTK